MPKSDARPDGEGVLRAGATDRVIRVSTAVVVLANVAIAAYISCWHAYAVVRAHGETA
jgi:hypothetical protein